MAKDSYKVGDTVRIYFPPTGVHGGHPIFPVVQGKVIRFNEEILVVEYDDKTVIFNRNNIAGVAVV